MVITKENSVRIGFNNIETTQHPDGWRPKYNYLEFYNRVLPNQLVESKYPWYVALCPFHVDKTTPNLRVNILSGGYKCMACGSTGNASNFIIRTLPSGKIEVDLPNTITNAEHIEQIEEYENSQEHKKETAELTLLVDARRAQTAHDWLFQQPYALQLLQRDRGLTEESIRKWRLGFIQGTVTIPIPDITGKLANLKFHKKWSTEYAKNQLFPWEAVIKPNPVVVIVEGEFDMMICRQNGINAVTQTFGANTWSDEFSKFFRSKTTYLAYDNDGPGLNAAIEVGRAIWKEHGSAFIIKWPPFMQPKEDNVDFFVKYKQTAADYGRLLSQAVSIMRM